MKSSVRREISFEHKNKDLKEKSVQEVSKRKKRESNGRFPKTDVR